MTTQAGPEDLSLVQHPMTIMGKSFRICTALVPLANKYIVVSKTTSLSTRGVWEDMEEKEEEEAEREADTGKWPVWVHDGRQAQEMAIHTYRRVS